MENGRLSLLIVQDLVESSPTFLPRRSLNLLISYSNTDGCVCSTIEQNTQRWLYGSHIDSKVLSLMYRTSLDLPDLLALALIPALSQHVYPMIGSAWNTGPMPFSLPSAQERSRKAHAWACC